MNLCINPVEYVVCRDGRPPNDLPNGKVYAYLLTGDGVWKMASSRHLQAVIPVTACRIAGLPPLTTPLVHLRRGRLPASLLNQLLEWARRDAGATRTTEGMYHIVQHGHWPSVVRPQQEASAARVRYALDHDPADVIGDVHSHHVLPAVFSPTDDADEQEFRLYCVMGRIFSERPTLRVRVGVYGDFLRVPAQDVFGSLGPFREEDA